MRFEAVRRGVRRGSELPEEALSRGRDLTGYLVAGGRRLPARLASRLDELDRQLPDGVPGTLRRALRDREAVRRGRRRRALRRVGIGAAVLGVASAVARSATAQRMRADLVRRAGHTKVFAEVGRRIAPPIDRTLHRLSAGRIHAAAGVLPTLVLVHTGRKSGREHHTPLAYVRHGDGFALAASNWGQANHPDWSHNLLADPEAHLEVDGEVTPVRCRLVTEEERGELWPRFVAMWPAYDTYVERAAGRDIRVFLCEPPERASRSPGAH